jgi:hypothetical protein
MRNAWTGKNQDAEAAGREGLRQVGGHRVHAALAATVGRGQFSHAPGEQLAEVAEAAEPHREADFCGGEMTVREQQLAETEATLGYAGATRTHCHLVDRGSDTMPFRFVYDLDAPFATLDIPARPCTDSYCGDASNETHAGVGDGRGFAFPAVVLSQTCELMAKGSMGFTLSCAEHVLAAFPCDDVETKWDDVPQTAHEALAAGIVPDGICSVQNAASFLHIDLDGYWRIKALRARAESSAASTLSAL